MGIGLGAAFGVVGAMVGGAIGAGLEKMLANKKSFSTTLKQLPPEVVGHPQWPLKKVREDFPVLVIPRSAVTGIGYSFWLTFDVETESEVYCLKLSLLRRFKMIRQIREIGWNWE